MEIILIDDERVYIKHFDINTTCTSLMLSYKFVIYIKFVICTFDKFKY